MTKWAITFADEDEFQLAHSCASISRTRALGKYQEVREAGAAPDDPEALFYRNLMGDLDRLLAKFEARLIADTSQDYVPETEDEEA